METSDLHAHADLLRESYVAARFRRLNPELPQLQNTDDEPLAFQKLEFRIDDPEEALTKLAPLEVMTSPEEVVDGAERDDEGRLVRAAIQWQRRGNSKIPHWDNTILGHLVLEADRLTVEVNSEPRSRRVRREIESRLGTGVHFLCGTSTSPDKELAGSREHGPLAERPGEEEPLDQPEVQEMLRHHLVSHYRAWIDQKIPVLGGKSPRQTVRSADGRAKVEALLVGAERSGPLAEQGISLDFVREELGLPRDG